MRARALAGGFLFLSVVSLWHRPMLSSGNVDGTGEAPCPSAGGFQLCAAIGELNAAVHNPMLRPSQDILPDRRTPGHIDPAIIQATIDATVCRPDYARSVRPAYAITVSLKRRLMDLQHPGQRMADFELDHLIPISIGGAPLDLRNLWLQPRQGRANAGDKNVLAYVLWRLVCEHRLPLRTAQEAISRNWVEAYDAYATPENVSRYSYRHAGVSSSFKDLNGRNPNY